MNAPFLFMAIWYGGFKGYFFESCTWPECLAVEKLSGEKLKQALLITTYKLSFD
jgi:hypothetical protein